jgi:NRAMP (natural resistance-associated macrophage protein)-like metal ion transporter
MANEEKQKKGKKGFARILKILGPGLITGAADDDPSGIATYSQTGAQFGYGQLWSILFLYPLMTAVQEVCARIGAVTKKGITSVVKEHYSRTILYGVIFLVVLANTINIGADIGAMGATFRLLFPSVSFTAIVLFFAVLMLVLEIFISYKKYARILKWLTITMLVYPATLFLISAPWGTILKATFLPHIEFSTTFFFIIVGVIGTTISPYMFFWQASEEVEEEIEDGEINKRVVSKSFIKNMRIDNALGMLFSNIISWAIIVVTGTVLNKGGVTNIATASDAAKALVPLVHTFPNAGFIAEIIFGIGIIGLGLLSVPVLAGSAAYAFSEAFNWNEGLYRKLKEAHGFYGVITIATIIGLIINFVGIDPIKALVVAAVVNGLVSIPLIFIIIMIASNKKIMGKYTSGWLSKTFLWISFIAIIIAALAMFASILL